MNFDFDKLLDQTVDVWEEVTSDQTSRTGHSAARVASSLANGVDPEVVALQATNSKKNNPDSPVEFTGDEMTTVAKWYVANQRRSAFTKQQAGSLIRNQRAADGKGPGPEGVGT
jgi:hypothetical protein